MTQSHLCVVTTMTLNKFIPKYLSTDEEYLTLSLPGRNTTGYHFEDNVAVSVFECSSYLQLTNKASWCQLASHSDLDRYQVFDSARHSRCDRFPDELGILSGHARHMSAV